MNKNIKLFFLLVYVTLACLSIWILKLNYLFSLLIIFYVPAIINLYWLKRNRLKILWFSFLALIFFAPPVELISRASNAWAVQTMFPEFLGLIPLENMLFAFVNFFWVLSFYEYFIADDKPFKISHRFWYLLILYWLLNLIGFGWFFYSTDFKGLDYHLIALPILVIPLVFLFYKRKKLFLATIKPTIFFFFVLFLYEIIALRLSHWWWPGNYLLPINFFGHIFPIDDIIIWYLLSTPVLIGGYEYFYKGYKEN